MPGRLTTKLSGSEQGPPSSGSEKARPVAGVRCSARLGVFLGPASPRYDSTDLQRFTAEEVGQLPFQPFWKIHRGTTAQLGLAARDTFS